MSCSKYTYVDGGKGFLGSSVWLLVSFFGVLGAFLLAYGNADHMQTCLGSGRRQLWREAV